MKDLSFLKQWVDHFTETAVVGVDLGSALVKVVEIDPSQKPMVLRRAAVIETAQANSAALLKQIFVKAGITARYVAVGLSSPEVIVRPFQFPRMPAKELNSAVQLEAEQAVLNGHSLDEVAIDWHTFSNPSTDSVRGVLAVAPKTLVADRLQMIEAAGLIARVIDVEGLALWNAYWALIGAGEPAPKTVLLINLGAETTNLIIAKGPDELIFGRDLQLGNCALVQGQEKEWVSEVQDSLSYVRSKGGLCSIDTVYVTGGGSANPNLPALLKTIVQVPIFLWNPLHQMSQDPTSPPLEDSLGPVLTLAVGLALRQIL